MATLVGIDPSFTSTGIALLNTATGRVATGAISREVVVPIFPRIMALSQDITDTLIALIEQMGAEPPYFFIHEVPPLDAMYASCLWGLDTLLSHQLAQLPATKAVYSVEPNYLSYIHARNQYPSSANTLLGKSILDALRPEYAFGGAFREGRLRPVTRFRQDEGVALVFLSRLYLRLRKKLDLPVPPARALIALQPRFRDSKESRVYPPVKLNESDSHGNSQAHIDIPTV